MLINFTQSPKYDWYLWHLGRHLEFIKDYFPEMLTC